PRAAGAADADPGQPTEPDQGAAGVRVPPQVPVRHAHRGTGEGRGTPAADLRAGTQGGLPSEPAAAAADLGGGGGSTAVNPPPPDQGTVADVPSGGPATAGAGEA